MTELIDTINQDNENKKINMLFINTYIHHKNHHFISNFKKINLINCNSVNDINIDMIDIVFSPSEPIDVSKYPNVKFIFGPHFSVFPNESLNIIKGNNSVYNLLSDWVINIWKSYPITNDINFVKLPFGVDTNRFIDNKNIGERNKILVYFKNRNPNHLQFIVDYLNFKGLEFRIFSYDHKYDENDYINYLQDTKYFICIDRHESQGFALQEALSCNVPLLVWNVKSMADEYGSNYSSEHKATCVPYWDDRCGEIFYEENEFEKTFEKYINNINNYKPREYILENLSFDVCENRFIDFVKNLLIQES